MSIRTKIIVPFLVLVVAVGSLTALLGRNAAERTVEERYERDMRNFESQPAFQVFVDTHAGLEKMRQVYGAGAVLVREPPSRELISTFAMPDDLLAFESFSQTAGLPAGAAVRAPRNTVWRGGRVPYRVFYGDPLMRAGSVHYRFFILIPESQIAEARWRLLKPMLLLAAAAMLAVLLVGMLTAGAISRPVRRLAAATRRVAAGDLSQPVEAGAGGEIGALAEAFNRMQADLRLSRENLVKSERFAAVGAIAAGIAHEVRNPLTAMRLTVEILQKKSLEDAAAREGLARMAAEIDRLSLTIEELLAFGRPTPVEARETDMAGFVNDVVDFMQRQCDHAGVKVSVQADGAAAHIDPGKMKQVLVNLILNGIQAMPRGGALAIRAARTADGFTISVSDTGPGIRTEARERLFDPFFSTKEGGTGIGLAISRQIVEEHGGSLDFETGREGTTFHIRLS